MKTKIAYDPHSESIMARVGRAALRFGLRKAGALLRASAPHAVRTAERLEALSEHSKLKNPPFFRV